MKTIEEERDHWHTQCQKITADYRLLEERLRGLRNTADLYREAVAQAEKAETERDVLRNELKQAQLQARLAHRQAYEMLKAENTRLRAEWHTPEEMAEVCAVLEKAKELLSEWEEYRAVPDGQGASMPHAGKCRAFLNPPTQAQTPAEKNAIAKHLPFPKPRPKCIKRNDTKFIASSGSRPLSAPVTCCQRYERETGANAGDCPADEHASNPTCKTCGGDQYVSDGNEFTLPCPTCNPLSGGGK